MKEVIEAVNSQTLTITNEILNEIKTTYSQRVNQFYNKVSIYANQVGITSNFINNFNSGTSIFEQIKSTQITKKDLSDVSDIIQKTRNSFFQAKAEDNLNKLNELIGEGYSILTEIGELIRGRNIQYLITYISTDKNGEQTLLQRDLKLKDFIKSFNLNDKGKISFIGLESANSGKTASFISDAEWAKLLRFQEKMRKEERKYRQSDAFIKTVSQRIKEVILYTQGNKELLAGVSEKGFYIRSTFRWLTSIGIDYHNISINSIYDQLDRNTIEKIIENRTKAVDFMFNNGRLIELAATLRNMGKVDFSKMSYKKLKEAYEEDTVPFYKQGDFTLTDNQGKTIEYQSKLANATVNLNTIINGMKKLTLALSQYEINKESSNKIGQEASALADKMLRDDLLRIFTVSKK